MLSNVQLGQDLNVMKEQAAENKTHLKVSDSWKLCSGYCWTYSIFYITTSQCQ